MALLSHRLDVFSNGEVQEQGVTPPASLPADVYQQSLKDNTEGWQFMLDRLQKYLD